jgi:macrodomain Ter protein organizer (MatP/YcbG family)
MPLPMEDDLTTARFINREPKDGRDWIQSHLNTLADRIEDAYRVTRQQ